MRPGLRAIPAALTVVVFTFLGGCPSSTSDACEAEALRCVDGVLEECHAADLEWDLVQDCVADGLVCDEVAGLCVPEA